MLPAPVARALRTAIAAAVALESSAFAASAQTNLVAAYSFNEGTGTTVADSSGKGNTGTISGATWTAAGKYAGALSFNGTGAKVTIPDAPSLRLTTAMTLEAWVRPTAVTNAWRDVIYKGNDNYYLEATSAPNSRPASGGIFGSTNTAVYGTAALPVNTWTHLAASYDGGMLRLYVNGAQVTSSARTGALATSSNPLQIGGDNIFGQYFQGTIDEVRVYNVALTAAQIQADMNAAVGGSSPVPDVTLTKTHTGSFTQGQTGASYTITVRNSGTGPTSGTVTATDTLPAGMTATAMSGAGWTCTVSTRTCTRSDLLAAGATYPSITLTVDVAGTAPATLTNTAAVSGGGDTTSANNTATDATTITPRPTPDLTLTKTHPGSFTQGQTGAPYTLTVRNGGSGATSGTVTVTDTLPGGLTATAIGGSGWSCTVGTLRCTRGDALAAGATYAPITLTVDVASTAPASVTNTATVSGGGETNTANDSASDATTINPPGAPDLTLTKAHVGPFTQGQNGASYTLTANNVGNGTTSGAVTVRDTLPGGLTATAISGTGWSCTLATLTCTRSDALAAGTSYPAITLMVNVSSTAPASVTNMANVSGGGETNTGNDTASDVTTITATGPSSTITLVQHAGRDAGVTTSSTLAFPTGNTAGNWIAVLIRAGQRGQIFTVTDTRGNTYRRAVQINQSVDVVTAAIYYAENIAGGANTVTVADSVTGGTLRFAILEYAGVAWASSLDTTAVAEGTGTAVSSGTATTTANGDLVLGMLVASNGATMTGGTGFVLEERIPTTGTKLGVEDRQQTAAGPAAATATLSASDAWLAAVATFRPGTGTTGPPPPADLTLTKTHTGTFAQGQVGATYALTVVNLSGNGPTTGTVTVTDTLPTGLTATAIAGTGWTCTQPAGPCTRSDALAAGATHPAITLTVSVAANAPASVTNTATVSGGGETNTGNDGASDATTVTSAATPDLTLTKTHVGSFTQGQTGASYTLTASNAGSSPSSGTVTVADTLPGGLTATALSGTGWSCSVATVTCTRSDALPAGASYAPITLTVDVANTAPSGVTNTATVSGGGDSSSANNTTSDPTSITSSTQDTQAPGAPGTLTANASGNQITVTWGAATDNVGVTSYRVEQCLGAPCSTFSEIATVTSTNVSPMALPLRVSANPNYFKDATGSAIVLNGSQTWNTLQDWGTNGTVHPVDFDAFVDFLVSHGHNFTLLWRTELTRFCGLSTTASSPPDFSVAMHPWLRTGPGTASDGAPRFDLTRFDQSYFDRLRARVLSLRAAGIYAGVYLFSGEWLHAFRCPSGDGYPFSGPNNINGIDDGGGTGSVGMTAPNAITAFQDAYAEKLVETLNDLTNVLWIVSEEAPVNSEWWNAHQIAHLRAYEATKPLQHPIGYGVLTSLQDSVIVNSDADWVAPAVRVSPTSTCGSGTPRCKVNINDSDHSYWEMWNDTPQENRNYAWENFATGNQVLFMDPYVLFYPRQNRNLCQTPTNGVCAGPDSRWDNFRDNLGYIGRTARKLNLDSVTPRGNLCSTGYCLAQTPASGAEYLVYAPNGGSFTVDVSAMPSSRTLNVEWLNPSTGVTTAGIPVPAGSSARTFTPPFSGDAVLYLVDSAGHQTTTTTSTTITYTVTNLTAGTYGYRVRASDAAGNLGPYSNVASAAVGNPGGSDLTLTKTHAGSFTQGQSGATYTLTAGNAGSGPTSGTVTVTDTLPAGLTATALSGTGWSCTLATLTCTRGDALAAGASYAAITLTVTVASNAPASVTNTAGVSGGGETNTANDTASDVTAIGGPGNAEPPSAPGTLTATAPNGTHVDLSWGAATDDGGVVNYRVERCPGVCTTQGFVKIAAPTGISFSDSGLAPDTTYSYIVRAEDGAGNLGPYSNVATVTTGSTIPELVAAYAFDEGSGTTAMDGSGNGRTGTLVNPTWTSNAKYGKALQFNGTSARVRVADAAALHLAGAMTLEAWVNPSAVNSGWRDVIYKGNDNYYLMATTTNGGAPAGGGTFGGTSVNVFAPTILPVGTWTHLATTYDGTTLRLYVNGAQVSSAPRTGTLTASTNPLEIGGDSIFGQYFAGVIDEVRVYNVALAPSQIQADMSTPLGASTPAVSMSASGIDFGSMATGSTSPTQNLTVTNTGSATLTISGISLTGPNPADFAQTSNCTATLAAGAACTVAVTFSPTTTGPRTAMLSVADNAPGTPHTAALNGSGIGFAVTPRVSVLTPALAQQFALTGSSTGTPVWQVDGIAGGSAAVGTITPAGLYAPPTAGGVHTVSYSDSTHAATATVYVTVYAGTFTHHNDNFRTGQNLDETVLTPQNVNSASFGKLYSYQLDGLSMASPLYAAGVTVPGQGVHNVVYVATQHDSVYAFDADGRSTSPLWQKSFLGAGVTTVPSSDTGECCDIAPEIGITGTPVIDQSSNTLYVVAKTKEGTAYRQRLHALDLGTGAEKFGAPVLIQASVPGTGQGSVNGSVPFDALRENQRPALLLSNGIVYIAFGAHGDVQPYHGWVLGYDAATLQQTMAVNLSPNAEGGGIWQANGGPSVDPDGNVYVVTGNGAFDTSNTNRTSFGDTIVKISPAGTILDFFTPHDQANIDANNFDLGAAGALLLPDQPGAHPHLLVSAGKNNTVYLVDRDNMGKYNPNNDGQIVQSLVNIFPFGTPEPGNYSAPVYFNGTVYFGPVRDSIQAFRLTNGRLSTTATDRSNEVFNYPGATLAISANGNGSSILWAIQRNGDCGVLLTCGSAAPGVLKAYDAADLGRVLFSSDELSSRDGFDFATKFSTPLVANGKVFVGSMGRLTVYGLLP